MRKKKNTTYPNETTVLVCCSDDWVHQFTRVTKVTMKNDTAYVHYYCPMKCVEKIENVIEYREYKYGRA